MEKKKVDKLVVTLIHFDKDGNYTVDNWVAGGRREARNIIESTVKEIKEVHWKDYAEEMGYTFTKKWENQDTCRLYFGDCIYESRHTFNFFINESL